MSYSNGYADTSNGTPKRFQREKVEFPINVPVLLSLDYDDGELVAGRFGDQYQYTFDAGSKIAWLDPEVRDLIQRAGATRGSDIAITKREVKGPNGRKRAQWEVEKVEEEPQDAGPTQAMIDAAERADAEARAAKNRAEAAALQASIPPAPKPAARAAASRPEAEVNAVCNTARSFADCIMAAVAACQLSSSESQKLGFPLPWTASDVRTIATTIYIDRTKGGR